jgi:hypothetical protein
VIVDICDMLESDTESIFCRLVRPCVGEEGDEDDDEDDDDDVGGG